MSNGPDAGFPGTGGRLNSQVGVVLCVVALLAMLLLAGCASAPPEQRVVSHVDSLPPVSKAVAVSCVKSMPDPPKVFIDPAATVKQRYYAMRAAIDDLDRYYKEAQIELDACAGVTAKETK